MEKQERKIKVRLLRPLFYRSSKGMLAGKTDEVVSLAESDAQGLFRSGAVVPDDLPPMVRCRALVTADVSCPEDPGERYSFIRNEEYSVPARIVAMWVSTGKKIVEQISGSEAWQPNHVDGVTKLFVEDKAE